MTPPRRLPLLPPSRTHKGELPLSITTGTSAKSALKSSRPFKTVRLHYRSLGVKARQYCMLANHCFGSALRSHACISNTFTSHVLCLFNAYRVITCIPLTRCDRQYLTLEVGMKWPSHTRHMHVMWDERCVEGYFRSRKPSNCFIL